jgi:predicted transcriptional regulator
MTAITLHLPDDLAARLSTLPAERVNQHAVAALSDLAEAEADNAAEFVNTDTVSAEEAAYLAEGIRRGLQAAIEGRERPAEEFFAEFEARHGITPRSSSINDAAQAVR